jgi:methionyl-tRNA formyltransferase
MKVEKGLDTGPVYARRTVPLDDEVDLPTLRDELVRVGSALLVEVLANGAAGLPVPQEQRGEPINAEKVTKEDLHLDWGEPAIQLQRVVRLGGAWTTFRHRRLGIVRASVVHGDATTGTPGTLAGTTVTTGSGSLQLAEVRPESRKPMSAEEWVRGMRPAVGERLGTD